MFSINSALLQLDKKLEEDNKFNEYLKKTEAVTGIERRKLVLTTCFILGAMVIIGYGAQLVCNGIGFAYPAYCSILAIETRNKEDDTLWLTYWVVFAALSLAEFFSDFILALIPFYWFLKCIFLMWCFVPFKVNGSRIIYYRFIRPVFLSHVGHPEPEESTPNDEHEKSS
ncbi:receptor expression-enhancing protein 5 [Parasteatoda tepidariorum]|uniref:Receptor expression-enhancing protein n=1 Tax=Parasteatoda tepidariorum TaxID=114398 RepID=A0A2L2XVU6_PARTP|nr:receptor expression-enhancing protein 5-like [Parasteatoda tepidariorum]